MARRSKLFLITAAVALFAIVLGTRLIVVDRFATDVPTWDQWDAEGEAVILPWLQGRLELAAFFRPHNEHRVAWTKALSFVLLWANGQWDSRLECAVNAALYAGLAATAFVWGSRWIRGPLIPVWFVTVTILTALPIAWHNLISAFHSQQYFLLWFSLVGIAWLTTRRQFTLGWWLGVASCACVLVAMASGLLAAVAVAALLVVDGRPRDALRRHGITLGICAVLVVTGWTLRVHVGAHDPLQSKSLADVAVTFWRSLQWPATYAAWFPLLMWSPWVRVSWRVHSRHRTSVAGERAVAGIGLWALLQFLAVAYARGAGGQWPAIRYLDTVLVGIGANSLAALMLFSDAHRARRWQVFDAAVAVMAVAFFLPGLVHTQYDAWRGDLPSFRAVSARREMNTRSYLATNDPKWLPNADDIPYPNVQVLMDRLRSPLMRDIMPASVRAPLAMAPASAASDAFAPGSVPVRQRPKEPTVAWGSFSISGAEATGTWRSRPMPAGRFRYWQFALAGNVGSLAITTQDGAVLQQIGPRRRPHSSWCRQTVLAPRVPSILVARDASTEGWFAFQAPVEIGAGSWWTIQVTHAGKMIAASGIVLALVCLGFSVAAWRHQQRTPQPAHTE